MFPIECVVRGYLTGSGWKDYKKAGAVSGHRLPPGLPECAKLDPPLYTPSTKAQVGHDETIDFAETERIASAPAAAARLRELTLAVYRKASEVAEARGVLIADTKLEFGTDADGRIVLGDEVLTPDSSRFWDAKSLRAGSRTGVVRQAADPRLARPRGLGPHPPGPPAARPTSSSRRPTTIARSTGADRSRPACRPCTRRGPDPRDAGRASRMPHPRSSYLPTSGPFRGRPPSGRAEPRRRRRDRTRPAIPSTAARTREARSPARAMRRAAGGAGTEPDLRAPVVGVVMGSDSDLPVVQKCLDLLEQFDIPYEASVLSAHRTPERAHEYASTARLRGLKIMIAAAGGAAHLAGVMASLTTIPVIGIPMPTASLGGRRLALLDRPDARRASPSRPWRSGTPGAANAALLAAQILALGDEELQHRLLAYRADLRRRVAEKNDRLREHLNEAR